MNWNRHGSRRLVLVITLCMSGAPSLAQSPDSQSILAQDIATTRASSKVTSVLWTRRADHYTLQVILKPNPNPSGPKEPVVTLWLLGADGAAIPTSRNRPAKNVSNVGVISFMDPEISYSVPLSAGESAVAAALKIDNEYFIEKLKPLN